MENFSSMPLPKNYIVSPCPPKRRKENNIMDNLCEKCDKKEICSIKNRFESLKNETDVALEKYNWKQKFAMTLTCEYFKDVKNNLVTR